MNLKHNLLTLLADGKMHSGEQLGQQLQVTRSAVWKLIQQLSQWGVEIHRIKGRGYQIPGGIELLNHSLIESHLPQTCRNKIKLEVLSEIDSTNQYILEGIKSGKRSGNVVLGEYQTAGRGRRNRPWFSPFGTNIYISFLWKFEKDPSELFGLSLAAAVAVANALEKYGITKVQLKWPNDVLWNYKKLAGILIELIAESHSSTYIVMGIGLNVSMPNTQAIEQPWTDLRLITNTKPKRNLMASYLISEVIEMFELFQQKGFGHFIKHWQTLDAYYNQPVQLTTTTQEFKGIAKGINQRGEFLLLHNNDELTFLQGDISLRSLTN